MSLRQRFTSWAACVSLSQRQVLNTIDAKNLAHWTLQKLTGGRGVNYVIYHITLLKLTTAAALHVRDLMFCQKITLVSPREIISI